MVITTLKIHKSQLIASNPNRHVSLTLLHSTVSFRLASTLTYTSLLKMPTSTFYLHSPKHFQFIFSQIYETRYEMNGTTELLCAVFERIRQDK